MVKRGKHSVLGKYIFIKLKLGTRFDVKAKKRACIAHTRAPSQQRRKQNKDEIFYF